MSRPADPHLPKPGERRHASGGYVVPRLDGRDNPGNAHWCEDHQKLECTKIRPGVKIRCHGPAVRGTDVCPRHAGTSKNVAMIRGEATITAWSALGMPRGGEHVDPGMAVLSMLHMSWMRVAVYGELLRRQVEGRRQMQAEAEAAGMPGVSEGELDETAGLIGHKMAAAGQDGFLYKASEEIRALVQLEASERDRCVKFAKTAHDMGISDRLTNLAEQWGDVVAGRITDMLSGLNLTPEQQAKVPALVTAHLSSIDMMSLGGASGNGR